MRQLTGAVRIGAGFILTAGIGVALTIGLYGCPTIDIHGGSTPGGDGTAPGDQIEWPALQVDPPGEDTAGFNQVRSADLNRDGLPDLITAAYESQPVQIHLQQVAPDGTISFRSMSIAGSGPIYQINELKIADMDQDGNLDIVLAVRDDGFVPQSDCASRQGAIIILFSPPDPTQQTEWVELNLTRTFTCSIVFLGTPTEECLQTGDSCPPTQAITSVAEGFDGNDRCVSSVDVADVNFYGYPDIVAAMNGCDDKDAPTKQIRLFINPGNGQTRADQTLVGTVPSDSNGDGTDDTCEAVTSNQWQEVLLQLEFVDAQSVRFSDVDVDGDLDVIALRPESKTYDITWQANPLLPAGGNLFDPFWGDVQGGVTSIHSIGESEAGLDIIEIGDLDGDGLEDVLALGKADRLLRWFRHPKDAGAQYFPWDVYNIVQYSELTPSAMEIADVDGDGQMDIVAAADGRIRWFTPLGESPYQPWSEQFVINDTLISDGAGTASESAYPPINSVHAVDINGDGRMDIAATFDRAGTDNDAVIWFENVDLTEEE